MIMPSIKSSGTAKRQCFPDDEAKFDWLPQLLDAYHIIDQGVTDAIHREVVQGRTIACGKGCAACCRCHKDIPVYPLELVGITWYTVEKLANATRGKLKQQLRDFQQGDACPFLIGNDCSIHPMRPMACRQFNVFDKVCDEGEDAFHTRRKDVLNPIKKYSDQAFERTLPFYGVTNAAQRKQVIKNAEQHRLAKELQQCSWSSLADKMESWDKNHG